MSFNSLSGVNLNASQSNHNNNNDCFNPLCQQALVPYQKPQDSKQAKRLMLEATMSLNSLSLFDRCCLTTWQKIGLAIQDLQGLSGEIQNIFNQFKIKYQTISNRVSIQKTVKGLSSMMQSMIAIQHSNLQLGLSPLAINDEKKAHKNDLYIRFEINQLGLPQLIISNERENLSRLEKARTEARQEYFSEKANLYMRLKIDRAMVQAYKGWNCIRREKVIRDYWRLVGSSGYKDVDYVENFLKYEVAQAILEKFDLHEQIFNRQYEHYIVNYTLDSLLENCTLQSILSQMRFCASSIQVVVEQEIVKKLRKAQVNQVVRNYIKMQSECMIHSLINIRLYHMMNDYADITRMWLEDLAQDPNVGFEQLKEDCRNTIQEFFQKIEEVQLENLKLEKRINKVNKAIKNSIIEISQLKDKINNLQLQMDQEQGTSDLQQVENDLFWEEQKLESLKNQSNNLHLTVRQNVEWLPLVQQKIESLRNLLLKNQEGWKKLMCKQVLGEELEDIENPLLPILGPFEEAMRDAMTIAGILEANEVPAISVKEELCVNVRQVKNLKQYFYDKMLEKDEACLKRFKQVRLNAY